MKQSYEHLLWITMFIKAKCQKVGLKNFYFDFSMEELLLRQIF